MKHIYNANHCDEAESRLKIWNVEVTCSELVASVTSR